MAGTPRGLGRVHLHAVVDTYGLSAFGFLNVSKQPEAAVAVLHNDVLPFYHELDLFIKAVLTDNRWSKGHRPDLWKGRGQHTLVHRIAMGLMVAGIVGNLIDRIRFGYVVDFLDVHWRGHRFPSFNVADAAICVGVGIYILTQFLGEVAAGGGARGRAAGGARAYGVTAAPAGARTPPYAGASGQGDGNVTSTRLSAWFLVGPTASGKSRAARWIAERHGYDILSADSMLVYARDGCRDGETVPRSAAASATAAWTWSRPIARSACGSTGSAPWRRFGRHPPRAAASSSSAARGCMSRASPTGCGERPGRTLPHGTDGTGSAKAAGSGPCRTPCAPPIPGSMPR